MTTLQIKQLSKPWGNQRGSCGKLGKHGASLSILLMTLALYSLIIVAIVKE